ncbi:YidH family protein [Nocardioides sp. cx-173]|uniref:YidH family protein n=1 Tax=Nocardioides sp. cx-173 TaxID=2898796 RepID=UPI001E43580A|nr:DUF202 domain-containing protein [Nocardioides sp. cx-173]MCD4526879.1 DUF202 domain-containing protein [Nocardioides sp. cx-173]UGB41332.1 DUF202 domain-containing protein [Nocardioides sp. cx-173]
MRERTRRPRWVYGEGDDPDYSASLANERTFLAWVRTALALLAGGVALDVVQLSIPSGVQRAIALALVVLALVAAAVTWLRWAVAERSMRRGESLPPLGFGLLLVLVVVAVCAVLILSWA